MHTFMLVMVKPLVVLVGATLVASISWALDRLIPDGPVKRFLYKKR